MRDHLIGALARVIPQDIRVATAYLTPDGFLELKGRHRGNAGTVRLLLGRTAVHEPARTGGRVLSQPGDHDELHGPAESVDWYTFLEGRYPWLLLTHEERRELLARGATPEAGVIRSIGLGAGHYSWPTFLRRDTVEVRRFLGSRRKGKILPDRMLDHRSPRNRLHAKAYLFVRRDGPLRRRSVLATSPRVVCPKNSELNLASYDRELVGTHLEGLVR